MELKTKLSSEPGRHDILITREFDLPVDLLFKAYTEAELVEQWMGTKVLKLDNQPHGGYRFETSNAQGEVVFRANGTIHECTPDVRIVRTFEMENSPFPAQLEFLDFEQTSPDTSLLKMHIIFRTLELRDQMLKLPFAFGINMAHDRLQNIFTNKN